MDQSAGKAEDHEAEARTRCSFHRCIIQAREEEVPPFAKMPKSKVRVRVFCREDSVFADWKVDTDAMLKTAFRADRENWKLDRFIRDPEDLMRSEQVLSDNFARIKKIFIVEASKSGFPCINWIKYADFCTECDILDPNVPLATIDRIFITANVERDEKHADNPPTALQRFEFLEVIARVALAKFKEPGIFSTVHESIQKLLDEHLFRLGDAGEWQEFRDKKLWTLEVNAVFAANLDLLRRIYDSYLQPRQKAMSMQNALKFLMRDTDLRVIEKDAFYCYGMCKMTVASEHEKNKQYFELRPVEFLEMIGRVAEHKFRHTTMSEIPLAQRIEYVLDGIIPPLLGVPRRDVPPQGEEELSESDDDY